MKTSVRLRDFTPRLCVVPLLACFAVLAGFSAGRVEAQNIPAPTLPGVELSDGIKRSDYLADVAWSGDGKGILSACRNNSVYLSDPLTGLDVRRVTLDKDATCVAFNSDSTLCITGSIDGTVRVWTSTLDKNKFSQTHAQGVAVTTVAFNPANKTEALSAGVDGTVIFWTWDTGTMLPRLKVKTDPSSTLKVAYSRSGKFIVTGAGTTLKAWWVDSGKESRNLQGHTKDITCVAFSPDGQWIVSGSYDKTVKVWDFGTGQVNFTLPHDDVVSSVAFSPVDARRFVSASADRKLKFWDALDGVQIATVTPNLLANERVVSVAFSPDGRRLACAVTGLTGFKDRTGRLLTCIPFRDSNPLVLKYHSTFEKVWDDTGSGAIFDGAAYKPTKIPDGYFALAHIFLGPRDLPANADNRAVLIAKINTDPTALADPVDFTFLGDTTKNHAKLDMAWWRPVAPAGYCSLGDVFTINAGTKPDATAVKCVRADLCVPAKLGKFLYADRASGGKYSFSVFEVVPQNTVGGVQPPGLNGLNVGAVRVAACYMSGDLGHMHSDPSALKLDATGVGPLYTLAANMVPAVSGQTLQQPFRPLSRQQVDDIIAKYGPVQHFHPDEKYFMTAVDLNEWPVLNQQDPNNPFLDCKEQTYPGNLGKAKSYVFVRNVHANFTDLQFWFFYGYNGNTFSTMDLWVSGSFQEILAASGVVVTPVVAAQLVALKNPSMDLDMLQTGTHIGDWEHITMRVDNYTRTPVAVGYTSHGDTVWYKPVTMSNLDPHIKVFSARNEHGSYPFAGENRELCAWQRFGDKVSLLEAKVYSRNICAEGGKKLEVFKNYEIVESDIFSVPRPEWLTKYQPPWRWGHQLDTDDDVPVSKFLALSPLPTTKAIGAILGALGWDHVIPARKGTEDAPNTGTYLAE